MIGWIYSDPVRIGFVTGVTRDDQNFLVTTKTIVGASNRSRVVTDIMYDDFMQLERPLGAEGIPSRLAAPPRVAWAAIEQRDTSSILIFCRSKFCDLGILP